MSGYLASGRAADVVLAVLMLEAVWLLARGRPAGQVALALGPGALMLLALRGALTGAGWPWVLGPLALSGPVHWLDFRARGLVGRG